MAARPMAMHCAPWPVKMKMSLPLVLALLERGPKRKLARPISSAAVARLTTAKAPWARAVRRVLSVCTRSDRKKSFVTAAWAVMLRASVVLSVVRRHG